MPLSSQTKCWIITEGLIGTENQCVGIAESLNLKPEIKNIGLCQPWKTFSPWLGFECARSFKEPLTPPWPDLVIAGGRKPIAACRYIKKQSKGKTFTAFIQDPRISPRNFDFVALAAHDPTRGPNVFVSLGNANRITHKRLLEERTKWLPTLGTLGSPRIAVLIGGDSKAYKFPPAAAQKLAAELNALPGTLMLTCSRRTREESKNELLTALSSKGHFLWDGNSENPYFGMLGWADYILVTSDSTSMLCEACTTGKPVYLIALEGKGAPRITKLHENLLRANALRYFSGVVEDWHPRPLTDTKDIAAALKESYAQHEKKYFS